MTISDSDVKILWGRAAGICSNPTCRDDLTVLLDGVAPYNVGEMAHVIARRPGGPRGAFVGGSDSYVNLILLCPTCHRKVDKAPPGQYPADMLLCWKEEHETAIRLVGSKLKFATFSKLKHFVAALLAENKSVWATFGPESLVARADPGSNLHLVWTLRKLDQVVPNNRLIVNAVEANRDLLGSKERDAFFAFKLHATSFEQHQYQRLDSYPTFPATFEEAFSE